MENLNVNPTLTDGNLLELSPMKQPNSILKPSQKDNLIQLQTPVHKHLKVSFITPKRTPAHTPLQPIKVDNNSNFSVPALQGAQQVLDTPTSRIPNLAQNLSAGFETPKAEMPALRKCIAPRRVGVSSREMLEPTKKNDANKILKVGSSQPTKTAAISSASSKWDSLRLLDENLRWRERVEVITKLDHQEYTECARECIYKMIDKALNMSVSKDGPLEEPPGLKVMSQPVASMSVENTDILSPIAPRSTNMMTPGAEVMTPVSTSNATFDISGHGSFLCESTDEAPGIRKHGGTMSEKILSANEDSTCFKTPTSVLKPRSLRSRSTGIITPGVEITTPISASNATFDISAHGSLRSHSTGIITPGIEPMTPVSASNATFDVSAHGSFLCENVNNGPNNFARNTDVSEKTPSTNDENCFKAPTGILKPLSVRPKKSSHVATRSQSVSDSFPDASARNDAKNAFTIGTRSYSFDLDNIPEDLDPFAPKKSLKTSPERNSNATPQFDKLDKSRDVTLDQSVFFTPSENTSFVMRPVDSAFGNEEFVDSASLLQQGQLDLDYLEKKTTGAISQDLRKQSLYVKFDPLLEGLGARQSILLLGRKSDIIDFSGRVTPVPEEPVDESTVSPREPDLLCDSPSQIGVENSTFDCSQVPVGSVSSRGDSVSSASPSLQNSAGAKPDFGIIEVLKYSEDDIRRVLERKKEKWMRERDASDRRCEELEKSTQNQKILTAEYEERCAHQNMAAAEEKAKREKKLAFLRDEKKRMDARILTLTQATSVLSQKTEKLQKNQSSLQANEIKQNEHIKAFREKCSASRKKILDLETDTAEAINKIMAEKAEVESSFANQLNGLQMKIKAAEFKVKSLQTTLDHKKNENKEYMKICDELVASNQVR